MTQEQTRVFREEIRQYIRQVGLRRASIEEAYRRVGAPHQTKRSSFRLHYQTVMGEEENVAEAARDRTIGEEEVTDRGEEARVLPLTAYEQDRKARTERRESAPGSREFVRLETGYGSYEAVPLGEGRYEITLKLIADRKQTAFLNGTAWGLLFPEARE